jgi:hypothetical protein
MKIVNVTASKVRIKVTVSGKRWLQDEESRDGWELVQEGRQNRLTTCFEKIPPLP